MELNGPPQNGHTMTQNLYEKPPFQKVLISAMVVTLAIFVIFLYHDWSSYCLFRDEMLPESKITETVGIIIHLDETLTMSARMAAASGNLQWEQRYRMFEPQLDTAILKAKQIAPDIFISDAARQTELANIALVKMENRSFELVRRGRLVEADALLSSPEYIAQKRAYAEGFRKIQDDLDKRKLEHLSSEYRNLILSLAFTVVFFPLLLFMWCAVYRLLQKYNTERKQAEEELNRTNKFLDLIVENIPDMIFIKDAKELRFVRFNKAGEELLGHSKEYMMGKNDYDLFPKELADFFTQKDREVLHGGGILDIPEERLQPLNSRTHTIHTKKVPILGPNGDPEYLLGISEDITERKLAETEREEAVARIKKLEGIIPICMHCKKIRDDHNSWNQLEKYITEHSEAMFSHGICPQCYEEQKALLNNRDASTK